MALRLEGQELSVIATVQDVNFPAAERYYTLKNDGTSSAFYRQKDDGQTFQGNAAALKALSGSELKAGESVILDPPMTRLEIVCAAGLTATVRVIPGRLAPNYDVTVNADLDIGNVHLLNTADAKIDPATEDKQDDAITALGELQPIPDDHDPAASAATGAAFVAIAVPANCMGVIFHCDQDVYLVLADSAGAPAQNGVPFVKGENHRLYMKGLTHIHHKQVTAAGTLGHTALIRS